jgi:hypothetical protein
MIKNFNVYNNYNSKKTQQIFLKVLRDRMVVPHASINGIPSVSLALSCWNRATSNVLHSHSLWKQIVNNSFFIRSFSTVTHSNRSEQEESSKNTASSSARSKITPEEEEEEEQVKRSSASSNRTTTSTAEAVKEEKGREGTGEPELTRTRRSGRRGKRDFIENKKGLKALFYFCFAMWFVSYFYPTYIEQRKKHGKKTWYQRLQDRYDKLTGKEPSQYLLPELDPNIPPQELKPVLVINISDVLLHSEYVPDEGYRWVKRKGLEDFIKQMSEVYEVVIFADDTIFNMANILEKVDPEERAFKLFKDQAYYIDGKWIKDLKLLGRPLEKIVFVEWNPDAFSLQPENALQVHRWEGIITPADEKFVEKLAILLKYLSQFQDLRSALKTLKQRFGTEDGEELMERFYQQVNPQQGSSYTSPEATTTTAPSGGKSWFKLW